MFLVDTNVLLDLFTDDPRWRPWSEDAIREALLTGPVGINAIIALHSRHPRQTCSA